jgi:hypothetical protein
MSDNIFGTTPTSTLMSVAEVAAKVMQGQQPIEEQDESWLDDEARDVEHKWKRMNTKLRVKWLAQIKVKADKEDMSQEKLDKILDEYGLTKFPKEKVWNEVQKIKPKWKKMSTAERTRWIDDLNDIAVKVRTSDADVQSILDDAKLKIKEEVEIDEAKEFWAIIDKAKGGEVMAISSDEKGAKSSVKMSNFSKHDYHFGKDPRTLKIVKVAGSYKQGEKMIGTKLSYKEEVAEAKGTAYPATIDTLRKIVKDKQHQTVMFDRGQALVDLFTASAMVQVYDALKPATKKKFEDMIKSKEGFMKSQAFAMKMIG